MKTFLTTFLLALLALWAYRDDPGFLIPIGITISLLLIEILLPPRRL